MIYLFICRGSTVLYKQRVKISSVYSKYVWALQICETVAKIDLYDAKYRNE
jgi:hypothetical protein